MANVAVTNTFTAGTTIVSSEINTNYADIVNYINAKNTGSTSWDVLKSAGATTLSSTLDVTGATTLASTLEVTGNVTLTAGLANAIKIAPTTNQLILGTTKTVTLSAPAPAGDSSIVTFPDLGDTWSVVGTEGTQTIAGAKTFSTQLIGRGAPNNSSAPAGYIGEVIASSVTSAASCGASGTYWDATSIELTAGEWDITGIVQLNVGTASMSTLTFEIGVSTTSGNATTGLTAGTNYLIYSNLYSAFSNLGLVLPSYRVQLSSTTTHYLKVYSGTRSSGTPTYTCILRARRMR
jgi:hypothetical protein